MQVYTFSREGGSSDHVPMKQKNKPTKTVSEYPFQFFERKNVKTKFESPYWEQLQTAVKGTKNTVTTSDNKIIHRKLISKPIRPFEQEVFNRGTFQQRQIISDAQHSGQELQIRDSTYQTKKIDSTYQM